MVSLFLIFAAFLSLGLAEEQVANIYPCEESSSACTINEVRIDPCNRNKKCVIKQGTVGRMTIDYTPNFDASKMVFGLYWDNGGDVPFPDLQSNNTCDFTTCPFVTGQTQKLTYSLPIGKRLPKGTYLFKCKFWNEENQSQNCCFKTNVEIRKRK